MFRTAYTKLTPEYIQKKLAGAPAPIQAGAGPKLAGTSLTIVTDKGPRLDYRVRKGKLQLSIDLNMPIVVHDREAHGDTFDLLRKYKPNALVHCFSGSVELMREAMRLGCYISLGGVVTFKNARHSVEVASEIPLDRLLLETDAPYMAPVPFRGKRCDSSMILYAAEKIASLRGITAQELLDITAQNAKDFYRL